MSREDVIELVSRLAEPDKNYVDFEIDGIRCEQVLSVKGTEGINALFEYELEVELGPPMPDLATLMGANATIVLRDTGGGERVITGVVAQAKVHGFDTDRSSRGTFVIRPSVYRQHLGRDCWASQDVTVIDVIREVLADYPSTVRYDITKSYPSYPYRVQYREDDWTYIARLIEEEGIYYWFDHGGGESEIVFADDSRASPEIDGIPALPYTPASAMKPNMSSVVEVSFSAQATSQKFSGRSFDLKRPGFRVEGAQGEGKHEVYDAPGGGTPDPGILKDRLRVGLEGAKAARKNIAGIATSVRLFPGRSFELYGHPVASLDGKFFITGAKTAGNAKVGISTRFTAIPRDTVFRALRVARESKQAGLQMGIVVGPDGQEVHPDEYGRVRVQLLWDRLGPRNERGGTWMRIAQRGTPGSLLTPRMGWNVATFNEEGGVDAPSTICRIHDGDHLPEYPLPGNMTRVVYKTATTPATGTHNEIYFEDRQGAEEMFIHASRDMHVRAKNRKSETVKNDSLRDVGGNYVLHVDEGMVDRVVEDQTIRIGGNDESVIQAKYSKSVSGNEMRVIGGNRSLKDGDSHTTTVEANRNLNVGAAMMDITLGTIMNTSEHNLTMIGGALVRGALGTITEDVAKLGIQVIGGARVDISKESQPTDVSKLLNETVAGGMILKSNARYLDNADTTSNWTVAASLDADAPDVWAEAEEKIIIKCGASTLTITQTEVRIEGTNVDLSGAHIDADTKTIDHN